MRDLWNTCACQIRLCPACYTLPSPVGYPSSCGISQFFGISQGGDIPTTQYPTPGWDIPARWDIPEGGAPSGYPNLRSNIPSPPGIFQDCGISHHPLGYPPNIPQNWDIHTGWDIPAPHTDGNAAPPARSTPDGDARRLVVRQYMEYMNVYKVVSRTFKLAVTTAHGHTVGADAI